MELSEARDIILNTKTVEGKEYNTFNDFLQIGKEDALKYFGIILGDYNTFEDYALSKEWNTVEKIIVAMAVISTNWDGNETFKDYSRFQMSVWTSNLITKMKEVLMDAIGIDHEGYSSIVKELIKNGEFRNIYDEELDGLRRLGFL